MTAKPLPPRPDLDQLKRQAKDLLRDARASAPEALDRFRILPAFAGASDATLGREPLALHDAQSVVAREHGFDSWNALRERVEELTLERGAAIEEFVVAATSGRRDRAARLLAMHPGIAHANLYTELVRGDSAAVEARLAAMPALATEIGGPRGWLPIHYVCYTSLASQSADGVYGLAAIARRLVALGVDPNARFPWLHHGVHRPVLHGAVAVSRSLPLAAALLDAGADPNDGVTLPLAAGGGDVDALELLDRYDADPNQPWATTGAATLYEILHWAGNDRGVRWLLDHHADPDPVFAENGETPLHVVATDWTVPLLEAFAARGADLDRRRTDGRTPYALARLAGNDGVAAWLREHGASDELSEVDRLVAACARGDRAAAEGMLRTHAALRDEIGPEHYGAFYRAAERNDTRALDAMLACGFDPNRPDESIGKTALHVAAMEGHVDAARLLIAHGASVAARDREFAAPPLVWAAEGSRSHARADRGHAAVGRLLLDAGSPVEWSAGAEPSEAVIDIVNAWRGSTTNV